MEEIKKQVSFEDIVNENLYLLAGKNSPVIQTIVDLQIYNRIKSDEIKCVFSDNIKIYEEFLKLVAKVVKELGLPNNSISYSQIVSRLIHEGYLSYTSTFIKAKEDEELLNMAGFLGIDVINGCGQCRHTSSIHQDIFNNLNLCGDTISCLYNPYISLNEAFNSEPNHAVSLIEYNGVYYIHDTFNQQFYEFKDGFTMEQYLSNQNIFGRLYYKPSLDIEFNGLTYLDMLNQIVNFHASSKLPHIDDIDLIEILSETNCEYNKNNNILSDFRQEAISYTKKIIDFSY